MPAQERENTKHEPRPMKEVIQECKDAPLEEVFRRLLANELGVSLETVTNEWIDDYRKQHYHPKKRYDIGSRYGGYSTVGKTFLTGEEIDAITKRAEERRKKTQASSSGVIPAPA